MYLVFNTAADDISTSLVIDVGSTIINQSLWHDRGDLFSVPMKSAYLVIYTNLSNVGRTIKLSLSIFWWINRSLFERWSTGC